jgi:transposase
MTAIGYEYYKPEARFRCRFGSCGWAGQCQKKNIWIFVEAGGSRREIAEQFDVSISSAIGWLQHFRNDGRSDPMPGGESVSPLEKHSQRILTLIAEQPDLTLDEMVRGLSKRSIPASRSVLSRFFARHNITVKKKPHSRGAQARPNGRAVGGVQH